MLGVAAVVAAVVVARVLLGEGSHSVDGAVMGDRSQWTAAVCAPHSELATSANFLYPSAVNIAYCASLPHTAGLPSEPMIIGEWPRDGDLERDIARLDSVKWYAAATVGDTTTAFILVDSPDRSLLEPLVPSGFTLIAPK